MRRPVPFLDLSRFPADLKSALKKKFAELLDHGIYSGGPEVETLETKLCTFTGSKEAIACSNGTDALEIALQVLDIGPGDEVLVPALTWPSTAEAVCTRGAKPIFVDTDSSGLIDLNLLDQHRSVSTKAIIPVHLYGKMVDMHALSEWAKARGILIIEDAAQAFGAKQNDRYAGTWGDVGCLSFYPTKNLGALGEAGAMLTQKSEIAERMRLLISHGQFSKDVHLIPGRNARIDSIQAGFLNLKLDFFEQWQDRRKAIAKIYLEALDGLDLILPWDILEENHNAHLFVIQTEKRNQLVEILNTLDIGTAVHYPTILPRMKAFRHDGKFPVAEKLTRNVLSLPLNPWLSRWDFISVIKMVQYAYSKIS